MLIFHTFIYALYKLDFFTLRKVRNFNQGKGYFEKFTSVIVQIGLH